MANQLKMAIIQSILHLHSLHWSQRQIARELRVDRETVRRCLAEQLSGAKPAIPPAGSTESKPATFCPFPALEGSGIGVSDSTESAGTSKPAIPPPGSATAESTTPLGQRAGRRSECQPYGEWIVAKVELGLSAQRIYQDLREEHGFVGAYDSVKRFVRRVRQTRSLPFRRLESVAGEEAQVDFGTGAPIVMSDGKRRRTHVFRIVLSYSRKGYSEVTYRQTTDDFLGCLENAFLHFGGVPRTLVIDNLKAAVRHPDWFDPELVPKVDAFCQHYGVVILPAKPRMPRHKGKVERGVDYVQENALKGHSFASLEAQNEHLLHWETHVADQRIHGTTRRQVAALFAAERAALGPLAKERFPSFREAQRKVHRDGHVEVAKAYYSLPPEYVARTVWVRWDARVVRIFNQHFEQIVLHVRQEPGRFSTLGEHLAPEKINSRERGAAWLLDKVRWIGPHSTEWAEAMLTARGIQGTRVLQGLIALTRVHSSEALENACKTAQTYGVYRLRVVRKLLQRPGPLQQTLPFLEQHALIRPLEHYAQVVAAAAQRSTERDRPGGGQPTGFLRHGWAKEATVAQQEGPAPRVSEQGSAVLLPPRSGYPSSGCSSAEPDSVSPDSSSIVSFFSFRRESHHE